MLGLSVWKLVMIAGVVTLMFGRGKVSELMGDVAKGIKSFKRGMAEDDDAPLPLTHETAKAAAPGEPVVR